MGLLTDIAALVIQAAQKPLTTPKREVRDAFGLPCGVTRHQAPTKGGTVPFTLYRPADLKQNPPVFLNIHGGGYVMRAPEQDDHICRYIANQAACAVVNVCLLYTSPSPRDS